MSRLGRGFPINRFVSDPPPAALPGLAAELITFQLDTGTGEQSIDLGKGGFTPNLILFWIHGNDTADAFSNSQFMGFGAAAGTSGSQTGSHYTRCPNGQNPTVGVRYTSDDSIVTNAGSDGVIGQEFDVTSFDSAGFTIDILTSDDSQRYVTALCLRVDEAWVGMFDSETSTGAADNTSPSFDPSLLLLATNGRTAIGGGTDEDTGLHIAACDENGNQFTVSSSSESGVSTTNTRRRHDTDAFCRISHSASSIDWEATMSLITNGFRLNYSSAPVTAEKLLGIAIAAPAAKVLASYDQPTSTGNQSLTGAGLTAKAVLELGCNVTSTDAFHDGGNLYIGGATSPDNESAVWFASEDNQTPSDADRYLATDATVFFADYTQTIEGEAAFTSFDADGHSKNWGTAPGTTRKGAVIWLGDTVDSVDVTAGIQDAEGEQLTPTYAIGTRFSSGIQQAEADQLSATLSRGLSLTAGVGTNAIGEQLAASIAALGHRLTASYHNAYGNALPTFETIGPITINPHRLNSGITLFTDRPFNGEGVNLYAAGSEALTYRRFRILGPGGLIKGSSGVHDLGADSITKTARVASAADPTASIVYDIPTTLAGVALNNVTTGVAGAASFRVAGDVTAWLTVGQTILISGSTANDAFYTVRATPSYAGGNTTIPVEEAVSDGTVDGDLAREVIFDVRKYLDDFEHLSNQYRTRKLYLDSSRAEVSVILGSAALLDVQVRAGGICRLRFVYVPDIRAGVQADTFRAVATSGPTSPDDATLTVTPLSRTVLEIDTPALQNAGSYTYTIQAENGSTIKELLSEIAVTPDAAGPTAPTNGTSEPW